MPVFNGSTREGVKGCIISIQQYYYPSFLNKAANLFYLLAKNHGMYNGNKRTAVSALLIFLANNNYWLALEPKYVVEIAKWVVNTKSSQKEVVISGLEHTIAIALTDFDTNHPIDYERALML